MRYRRVELLLKPARPLGRETAQLPDTNTCVTIIPAQHKATYVPNTVLQNVQIYKQQANDNHMSAHHYSIEYREDGTCVDPLVALSIFCVSERKTRMTVYHLIIKVFKILKVQG